MTKNSIFQFGEILPDYQVAVLNERAVRAGAGLLFLFAFVAFMNAWLVGNFYLIKVFVTAFLIDFIIRVAINPKYSPSLVLGQWITRNQQPEYTGAPQKRFAWAIGLTLSVVMFYLIVIENIVGPVNLIICGICLAFMFFETAFGICIGCTLYNLFNKEQAKLCPGNVCDIAARPKNNLDFIQISSLSLFVAVIFSISHIYLPSSTQDNIQGMNNTPNVSNEERCRVPAFAKAIGHEEKWKLHNGCK
jgi:Domain of unknown function (DUF4395)